MGREETLRIRPQDNSTGQIQQGEGLAAILSNTSEFWNRLAEEVNSREIDDFIALSVENGPQHEKG